MTNDEIKAKLEEYSQDNDSRGEDALFPAAMLSLLESAEDSKKRLAEFGLPE